ncbi:hypothetical protein P389DRAFT_166485 [Cystobasidium minutum MCA 4210]|uniref:uncharacterized protein n=1 Tax=Cystobasidium minutum MCA 4210 TaxID=1397322 RepID=UPI0034CF5E4E|eukprot:jgi/Rhomi1/166485/fgenesh1_kg.2_\
MQTAFIPKRPIGPFRGSLLGFLGGVCAVSAFGFYTLFDKYTTASALLLQSVDDLKRTSLELQNYTERLEKVEERCKRLEVNSATREETARIEKDSRALYDEARLSLMDVKRAVWGLEEHTRLLQEDRARTIRIV